MGGRNMVKKRRAFSGEKVFDFFVYLIIAVLLLIFIVPLLYVLSSSFTPYSEIIKHGGFVLIPQEITLSAYKQLLGTTGIVTAFKVSLFVTVVGTTINMILSVLVAYPLSKKDLPGRQLLTLLVVFTMMFNGGLIPTYLTVKGTRLLDTVWALIIPGAISTYNVILLKNYFQAMPEELFEAATIDGAGGFRSLLTIAVPLAKPVTMTVMLLYMVGNWNVFYPAIYYIYDPALKPLQVILRDILLSANSVLTGNVDAATPTLTLQMAAIVVTSVPIILVYPFIQKHFTKGIMMGAVKG